MIASLMMYDRPELSAPHARYWALIRAALRARGIDAPVDLSNDVPELEVWRSPNLVFSQTCGMPYRLLLHDQVALVGTPDFGIAGCPPGYYNSVFVVREGDSRNNLSDFRNARFAYNQKLSHSGYAAAYTAAKEIGFWFQDRCETGGHRQSARAVASGEADMAAIDAVTWRLIVRYDPFSKGLRVLTRTAPTPGLPYITSNHLLSAQVFGAVQEAMRNLDPRDRHDLGLCGLVKIPMEAYLTVPNPPKGAQ
ncbi:MAG: PhnD/SsuA/transferrin family substrate-binding protein [Pseudomonadota bacterium]